MKFTQFILCLVVSLGLYSCQSSEKTGAQSLPQTVAEKPPVDSIVRDTLTNSQGIKLTMAYDNANHTATFELNGEIIKLKQDTVASGIKYSNSDYEYSEHHGEITLKKGGQIVFSNQP